MIYNYTLIYIIHIAKLFNLPSDISRHIYFYLINNSAQLIIDKWYSYINIHNINLCYIVNKIPILYGHTLFGHTITYYDLHDKNLYITLSICNKYIKPSISDKNWWRNFSQNGFNGLIFSDYDNDIIVRYNLLLFTNIFGCF